MPTTNLHQLTSRFLGPARTPENFATFDTPADVQQWEQPDVHSFMDSEIELLPEYLSSGEYAELDAAFVAYAYDDESATTETALVATLKSLLSKLRPRVRHVRLRTDFGFLSLPGPSYGNLRRDFPEWNFDNVAPVLRPTARLTVQLGADNTTWMLLPQAGVGQSAGGATNLVPVAYSTHVIDKPDEKGPDPQPVVLVSRFMGSKLIEYPTYENGHVRSADRAWHLASDGVRLVWSRTLPVMSLDVEREYSDEVLVLFDAFAQLQRLSKESADHRKYLILSLFQSPEGLPARGLGSPERDEAREQLRTALASETGGAVSAEARALDEVLHGDWGYVQYVMLCASSKSIFNSRLLEQVATILVGVVVLVDDPSVGWRCLISSVLYYIVAEAVIFVPMLLSALVLWFVPGTLATVFALLIAYAHSAIARALSACNQDSTLSGPVYDALYGVVGLILSFLMSDAACTWRLNGDIPVLLEGGEVAFGLVSPSTDSLSVTDKLIRTVNFMARNDFPSTRERRYMVVSVATPGSVVAKASTTDFTKIRQLGTLFLQQNARGETHLIACASSSRVYLGYTHASPDKFTWTTDHRLALVFRFRLRSVLHTAVGDIMCAGTEYCTPFVDPELEAAFIGAISGLVKCCTGELDCTCQPRLIRQTIDDYVNRGCVSAIKIDQMLRDNCRQFDTLGVSYANLCLICSALGYACSNRASCITNRAACDLTALAATNEYIQIHPSGSRMNSYWLHSRANFAMGGGVPLMVQQSSAATVPVDIGAAPNNGQHEEAWKLWSRRVGERPVVFLLRSARFPAHCLGADEGSAPNVCITTDESRWLWVEKTSFQNTFYLKGRGGILSFSHARHFYWETNNVRHDYDTSAWTFAPGVDSYWADKWQCDPSANPLNVNTCPGLYPTETNRSLKLIIPRNPVIQAHLDMHHLIVANEQFWGLAPRIPNDYQMFNDDTCGYRCSLFQHTKTASVEGLKASKTSVRTIYPQAAADGAQVRKTSSSIAGFTEANARMYFVPIEGQFILISHVSGRYFGITCENAGRAHAKFVWRTVYLYDSPFDGKWARFRF